MSGPSRFPWFSIVALGVSVAGLFVPPIALVALVVGTLALKRATTPASRRIAQGGLAISVIGLMVIGSLLLFGRGQHPREVAAAECRVGLEALMLAEDAHLKARGRYAGSEDELGVPLAKGERQFFLAAHGVHEAALRRLGVGQGGQCPDCRITMACLEGAPDSWWTITSGGKPIAHDSP